MEHGKVYLVGAGPGDLGLVTVKAKSLITQCDVLVYDYLANPKIKEWTKPGCEFIYVGKRPNLHAIPQSEIESVLVDRAKAGKMVVRLKGGDPFIFGRGGEEVCRLREDGLDFEVVPGVTAALGSAAYAGVPLTHRDYSSSISFLTGHEDPEKHEMHVDFEFFAKSNGTLCIYMGMGHLGEICQKLMTGGRDAKTPVAVVRWATMAKQRSVVGTLETIESIVKDAGLSSPAVVIVGPVANLKEQIDWFEKRPLYGKRIAVTRNQAQAGSLSRKLEAQGAEVIELPLIHVELDYDEENRDEVFGEIACYEWIVFTSPNGVKFFFELFFKKFKDLRCLGPMRIACIGQSTAAEVEKYNLQVDVIPTVSVAENFAEELLRDHSLEHTGVLVVTGNQNRDVLVKALEEGQAIVDTLRVYKNTPTDLSEHPGAVEFREQGADVITFTSASTVQSFIKQVKSLQMSETATRPKGVSIGPITSAAMKEKGLPVDAEAHKQNLDGLVDAIIKLVNKS